MIQEEKRPKIGNLLIHDGENRMLQDEHLVSGNRVVTVQIGSLTQSCIRVYRHKIQEEQIEIAPLDFLRVASKFRGGEAVVEEPKCYDGQIRGRITGNRMARIQLVQIDSDQEESDQEGSVSGQIELTLDEMNYLVSEMQRFVRAARSTNGRS